MSSVDNKKSLVDDEKFVRWQAVLREHLSATTNLVLGLATGFLAFEASLLVGDDKLKMPVAIFVTELAVGVLIFSVGAGLWCAMNRLKDFRLTAKRTREKSINGVATQDKKEVSGIGDFTWCLLRAQLVLFIVGACLGLAAVIMELHCCKLAVSLHTP